MADKTSKMIVSLFMAVFFSVVLAVGTAVAKDLPKFKLKVAQAMMPKTSLTHQLIEDFTKLFPKVES